MPAVWGPGNAAQNAAAPLQCLGLDRCRSAPLLGASCLLCAELARLQACCLLLLLACHLSAWALAAVGIAGLQLQAQQLSEAAQLARLHTCWLQLLLLAWHLSGWTLAVQREACFLDPLLLLLLLLLSAWQPSAGALAVLVGPWLQVPAWKLSVGAGLVRLQACCQLLRLVVRHQSGWLQLRAWKLSEPKVRPFCEGALQELAHCTLKLLALLMLVALRPADRQGRLPAEQPGCPADLHPVQLKGGSLRPAGQRLLSPLPAELALLQLALLHLASLMHGCALYAA